MILADTSVWVNHFRAGDRRLEELLARNLVGMHPFVVGELACGTLRHRATVLARLNTLASASPASDAEVHHLLESHHLWGKGLGWIDLHLLASVLISDWRLWTVDAALEAAAATLGVSWPTEE